MSELLLLVNEFLHMLQMGCFHLTLTGQHFIPVNIL